MEFLFNQEIINNVINEIKKSDEYVRIAVFQIHNKSLYDAINEILNNGIKVEIFTLPYDSINIDNRDIVIERMEKVKSNGAKIYFSHWGVGDPERTTTAVGRWYSFHGKFIVTDKSAISLSANLTEDSELDAMLIYNDEERIKEFNDKFDMLIKLFINDNIKNKIVESKYIQDLKNNQ